MASFYTCHFFSIFAIFHEIIGLVFISVLMQTLHLENIDLRDLSSLPKLGSLDTLHLADNWLTELPPLSQRYPRLEMLDLRRNSLTSVTGAQSLSDLTEVLLEGNPLCQQSIE